MRGGGKRRWFKSRGRIQIAVHFILSKAAGIDHAISPATKSASILHKVESIKAFLPDVVSAPNKSGKNKRVPDPMRLLGLLFVIVI